MAKAKGYLTIRQAAKMTGYSRDHMYRMVERRQVVGAIKLGRDWLIPRPVRFIRRGRVVEIREVNA